jgi:hypothetical protein
MHRQWIKSNANVDVSDESDWAEAWFALDALMHTTCHVSARIISLRASLRADPTLQSEIDALLNELKSEHTNWRQRRVVQLAKDTELMTELLLKVNLDRGSPNPDPAEEHPCGFLDYPALTVSISDYFLASRLNNWRAIKLHISLIEEPNWGVYDARRIVDAIDLCRTHAALGAERNYLGAEKSVGLYLAGVVFGGPFMYAVRP